MACTSESTEGKITAGHCDFATLSGRETHLQPPTHRRGIAEGPTGKIESEAQGWSLDLRTDSKSARVASYNVELLLLTLLEHWARRLHWHALRRHGHGELLGHTSTGLHLGVKHVLLGSASDLSTLASWSALCNEHGRHELTWCHVATHLRAVHRLVTTVNRRAEGHLPNEALRGKAARRHLELLHVRLARVLLLGMCLEVR